jgi:hypothetical protein
MVRPAPGRARGRPDGQPAASWRVQREVVAVADPLRSLARLLVSLALAQAVDADVFHTHIRRRPKRHPLGGDRVARPVDANCRTARDRDQFYPSSLERALRQRSQASTLLRESLLGNESQLYLPQEHLRDLGEALAFRDRGEVGEPYPFAPCLHAALVVAFADAGEARLKQVVIPSTSV